MEAVLYVHSFKENNYDLGVKLGLKNDALNFFLFACNEVKLTLDVNEETGKAVIVKVDDRPIG